MSLSPHALTSLDRVKATLPNLEGTAQEDEDLINLINEVTSLFESIAGRRLKSRAYVPSGAGVGEENILLSGNAQVCRSAIYFPEWPLTAVSAITIKPSNLSQPEAVSLVAGEDWTFSETGLITLIDGNCFLPGVNNVEVSAVAGYLSSHRLWASIEKECVDQVRYEWAKARNPQDLVTSISDPGGSVSYFQGPLLPQVRMLLENTLKRRDI